MAGASLSVLVGHFGIHRTTGAAHLERHGIARRATTRALNDQQIDEAVRRYERGESWVTIAQHFGVDPATVGKELKRRGVVMRQRRGATTHRDEPA